MTKKEIISKLDNMKSPRSAWDKGVQNYAYMILEDIEEDTEINLETALNGAKDWKHYSWSGCALCYDGDIAKMVCNRSEYQRYLEGKLVRPNKTEEWLDVQARALYQAWMLIEKVMKV